MKLEYFSQLGQDIFVLDLINESSTYLEVGCQDSKIINNTYLLEQKGWTGISIDIINYSDNWKSRKNKFVCSDALKTNFKALLEWQKHKSPIGFLSIDIEGNGSRYECLKRILSTGYEFKIICIEHDSYKGYIKSEKEPQIELLKNKGYELVVENIGDKPEYLFEDWWVNPKFVNTEKYSKFISKDIVFYNLFTNLGYDI